MKLLKRIIDQIRPPVPATAVNVPGIGLLEFVLHTEKEDKYISDPIRRGELFDLYVPTNLQKMIKPGHIFIDIGANIGWFTVIGSKLVGSGGRVFAFEPDPDNLKILRMNVAHNRCRNVKIFGVAAGEANKVGTLYRSEDNQGDHQMAIVDDRSDAISVSVRRLDDILMKHTSRIDVVKIDTQGSECAALRGMQRLLAANPKVRMILEFWPYGLARCGSSTQELATLLRRRKSVLWLIPPDGEIRRITPDSLIDLGQGAYSAQGAAHCDLISLAEGDRLMS